MKHPIQVVMLPTDDVSQIWKNIKHDSLWLVDDYTIREAIRNNQTKDYQHLYITISSEIEPIKEGDWYYESEHRRILKCNTDVQERAVNTWVDCRKIIATTDPKLLKTAASNYTRDKGVWGCDRVQQSFIEEYVNNPKGKWEVEYEQYQIKAFAGGEGYKLKLNQDNTITISSVEEKMIPMDKVLKLVEESNHFSYLQGVKIGKGEEVNGTFSIEDWIKKNL